MCFRTSSPRKQNDMEDRYTNRSRAEEPPDQNMRHNSTGFAGDLKGKSTAKRIPTQKADPNLLCRYTYLAASPETQDGRRFQPRILRRRSSKFPGAQAYRRETEGERRGKEKTRGQGRRSPPTVERENGPAGGKLTV